MRILVTGAAGFIGSHVASRDSNAALLGEPLTEPGDVPHSQADNTLLRSLFPDVEPVALDDGRGATADWMRGWLDVPSTPTP